MKKSDVEYFYDQFSSQQIDTGINRRHQSIDSWSRKFGLRDSDNVLEIGCEVWLRIAFHLNSTDFVTFEAVEIGFEVPLRFS